MKVRWAGWLRSWNQDCWEKYQPQICRWYHFNGRKWRGTKEPLDEGERGEWKSCLKIQHSKNEDHGIRSYHFMANRWGKSGKCQISFSWALKSTWTVTAVTKLKDTCSLEEKLLKSRDITLLTKIHVVKAIIFSSSHMWMWELDPKEDWAPKNWCFQTVVLEKTLESPLDSREIKSVNPKRNQSWIFIGRTGAEAEAPVLWLPYLKSWLIGKDPDAG